jgi:hypothetical protein
MRELRNLTPSITTEDNPRPWKVVGLERAHLCTFCGGPAEATVGCPDETAPLIFQVGVCTNCLVDCVMRRFREVKHQRIARLAHDEVEAANLIREAREQAGVKRYDRRLRSRTSDPAIEAEAARRLAGEEEAIARRFDLCPDWNADEYEKDIERLRQERRKR